MAAVINSAKYVSNPAISNYTIDSGSFGVGQVNAANGSYDVLDRVSGIVNSATEEPFFISGFPVKKSSISNGSVIFDKIDATLDTDPDLIYIVLGRYNDQLFKVVNSDTGLFYSKFNKSTQCEFLRLTTKDVVVSFLAATGHTITIGDKVAFANDLITVEKHSGTKAVIGVAQTINKKGSYDVIEVLF